MAGALYIPNADRSTRWFLDDYPNQFVMPRIDKTLLHSTETPKTGSCPGYSGGGTAPQLTINPWPGYQKVWQHFPLNRAGRALGNPTTTPVSENKDNVEQIEIIGYSDPALGRQYGCYLAELPEEGLDYLAGVIAFIHTEWPHGTLLPSTWPLYKVSSYASLDAAHMTSSQYDGFEGILAHLHAPKPSTHGDVALNIKSLKAKIDARLAGTGEDDMPTVDEIWDERAPVIGSTKVQTMREQVQRAHINAYRSLTQVVQVEKKVDDLTAKVDALIEALKPPSV